MGRFVRALLALGVVVAIAGCSSGSKSPAQKHSRDNEPEGPNAVGGDMFPVTPCDRSGDEHAR